MSLAVTIIPDREWTKSKTEIDLLDGKPKFCLWDGCDMNMQVTLYAAKLRDYYSAYVASGWISATYLKHRLMSSDKQFVWMSVISDLETLKDVHNCPEVENVIKEVRTKLEDLML